MHRESPGEAATPTRPAIPGRHDNWLAPLYFEGQSANGNGYFHIPPLLTYTEHTSHSGFNLVGPSFCKWKGRPVVRRAERGRDRSRDRAPLLLRT